jgi:hypothetical protein
MGTKNMTYEEYINSAAWAKKRKSRLILDGYCCRLCEEDGSRFQLEVHHKPSSYKKIPNESVENDLITLCSRCHNLITDAIREDRYGRRELGEPIPININIQARQEINHVDPNNLQIDFERPVVDAQRAIVRPAQQMDEIDETDYVQKAENGRRL